MKISAPPTILCFGEILFDVLTIATEHDGNLPIPIWRASPGGAPANAAVAAARLGATAGFCGGVAQGALGDRLVSALETLGIQPLIQRIDAPCPMAFVELDETGERSFTFQRSGTADLAFRPEHFKEEWFNHLRVFHICSNTLTEPAIAATTDHSISLARQAGATVSFDINVRANLWADPSEIRPAVEAALQHSDVVKCSHEEAELLFGAGTPQRWGAHMLELGATAILMTDGGNPVHLIHSSGEARFIPPAVRMEDATGAGDAFTGALLSELAQTSLQDLLADETATARWIQTACAAGALTASRQGAFGALPSRSEVDAFMQ